MNYDELIKSWHIKATNEDYFSKFVFEYLAFIAFLKKKKFTDAINDRQAIQKLKRDENIRNNYLPKLNSDQNIKESWTIIKQELDRVPLGNISGNGLGVEELKWWNCSGDQLTENIDHATSGIIHGLDDWENMVEFWYSIRNNFFHGGKDPDNSRDRLLIENGYKTLCPLVDIFLCEQR